MATTKREIVAPPTYTIYMYGTGYSYFIRV